MKYIVKDTETDKYIGTKVGGYPRRHEMVKFKKYARRFKSIGGAKRAIRHRVKNPVYWNAISKRKTPPRGAQQFLTVFPDKYEFVKVKI